MNETAIQPTVEPLIVKAPVACLLLGISQPTLTELVRTGQLPYITIGKRRVFSVDDIRQYISQNRHSRRPGDQSRYQVASLLSVPPAHIQVD